MAKKHKVLGETEKTSSCAANFSMLTRVEVGRSSRRRVVAAHANTSHSFFRTALTTPRHRIRARQSAAQRSERARSPAGILMGLKSLCAQQQPALQPRLRRRIAELTLAGAARRVRTHTHTHVESANVLNLSMRRCGGSLPAAASRRRLACEVTEWRRRRRRRRVSTLHILGPTIFTMRASAASIESRCCAAHTSSSSTRVVAIIPTRLPHHSSERC